jgi:hypothetical protein
VAFVVEPGGKSTKPRGSGLRDFELYDSCWWCLSESRATAGSASATSASVASLESATLVLGQATPHAGVLTRVERPAKARLDDRATTANGLGLLDLKDRGAGVPDREEQLRVLLEAGSLMAPVHG